MQAVPSGRFPLYLLLWVLTPLVSAVALHTPYPNQITVGYELFQVCAGAVLLKDVATILRAQAKWIAVLLLYAGTFIVVSYYGVDFATSVEYFVLYLPVLTVLPFMIAFAIGYVYPEERTFKYLMVAAPLLLIEVLLEIQLSPDQERFGASLNLSMNIPVCVFSGQMLLALICLIVVLMSLKKTIVVIAVMSFVMAYLLKGFVRRGVSAAGGPTRGRSVAAIIVTSAVLLVATSFMLLTYSSFIIATIARFSDAEDVLRAAITYYSLLLLQEHFPWGIGWFGFLSLSIGVIPVENIDVRGVAHAGANLHNSYMTWALEGGAPILLIVMYLFWKLIAAIRSFLRHRSRRLLGATLLIWLLGGMIFGAFQQWHMTDAFWQLFGFTFGCYARYRSGHEVDDSASRADV